MLCFVCVSSRLNALRLEEKEKKEKEMVQQIIEAAEQYKAEFYSKRSITIENNKKTNREKEKVISLSVTCVLSIQDLCLNFLMNSQPFLIDSCFWRAKKSFMLKLTKTAGRRLLNSFLVKYQY